jgi:hypothetical protein
MPPFLRNIVPPETRAARPPTPPWKPPKDTPATPWTRDPGQAFSDVYGGPAPVPLAALAPGEDYKDAPTETIPRILNRSVAGDDDGGVGKKPSGGVPFQDPDSLWALQNFLGTLPPPGPSGELSEDDRLNFAIGQGVRYNALDDLPEITDADYDSLVTKMLRGRTVELTEINQLRARLFDMRHVIAANTQTELSPGALFTPKQGESKIAEIDLDIARLDETWDFYLTGQAKGPGAFFPGAPEDITETLLPYWLDEQERKLRRADEAEDEQARIDAFNSLTEPNAIFWDMTPEALANLPQGIVSQMFQNRRASASIAAFFPNMSDEDVAALKDVPADLLPLLLEQQQTRNRRVQTAATLSTFFPDLDSSQLEGLPIDVMLFMLQRQDQQAQRGAFRTPRGLTLQPLQRVE